MSRRPELHASARPAKLFVAPLILASALAMTACTGSVTPAPSSATPTSSAPTPSATESTVPPAAAPVLVPEGTAEDNLPMFTAVTAAVWAGPDNVSGRAYIDALVAAGFDKAAMQLTPDQTTIGNPAETIQFSVRWGDQCLIGQVGPSTGSPVAVVEPLIGTETCLVGNTRTIDW